MEKFAIPEITQEIMFRSEELKRNLFCWNQELDLLSSTEHLHEAAKDEIMRIRELLLNRHKEIQYELRMLEFLEKTYALMSLISGGSHENPDSIINNLESEILRFGQYFVTFSEFLKSHIQISKYN